jgi:CheY-like chemotaxis protein
MSSATASTPQNAKTADGRPRVLIVEDNFLAAVAMTGQVTGWGYDVLGPVASLAEACRLAREENFCGAILDINLRGETSVAVADILDQRRRPYIFVTGYGNHGVLPTRFADKPFLNKPVDDNRLHELVNEQFGRGTAPAQRHESNSN